MKKYIKIKRTSVSISSVANEMQLPYQKVNAILRGFNYFHGDFGKKYSETVAKQVNDMLYNIGYKVTVAKCDESDTISEYKESL